MDAKEAKRMTEASADNRIPSLLAIAHMAIRGAAGNGECKVSNIFANCYSYTPLEKEQAYALLEQQGYLVMKLGDSNVTVSW